MTIEEIKIRQLTNQYLIQKSDKETVVRDLCGVQAQFLSNAIHSLKIRCYDFDESMQPTVRILFVVLVLQEQVMMMLSILNRRYSWLWTLLSVYLK